jgi:SAM-dependent methyltransferase
MLWIGNLASHGEWQVLRQTTADLAQLQPGESVLDVGCGTGTLALIVKRQVGAAGRVCGIDPSGGMITRARHKATHQRLPIDFRLGVIERIPFPDQSFDVVLSTFMMHQLPDDLKREGLAEIARVVDTKRPEEHNDLHSPPAGRVARGHTGHAAHTVHTGAWNSGVQDQPALMREVGYSQIESGDLETRASGLPEVGYVIGRIERPRSAETAETAETGSGQAAQ